MITEEEEKCRIAFEKWYTEQDSKKSIKIFPIEYLLKRHNRGYYDIYVDLVWLGFFHGWEAKP